MSCQSAGVHAVVCVVYRVAYVAGVCVCVYCLLAGLCLNVTLHSCIAVCSVVVWRLSCSGLLHISKYSFTYCQYEIISTLCLSVCLSVCLTDWVCLCHSFSCTFLSASLPSSCLLIFFPPFMEFTFMWSRCKMATVMSSLLIADDFIELFNLLVYIVRNPFLF